MTRTLKFSQTNLENGYESDEIEVEIEWGRYTLTATDPPPEEEEYPEHYVPVPLDANGEPVTRYIRILGGGGLDEDDGVGCPPQPPEPLDKNDVGWNISGDLPFSYIAGALKDSGIPFIVLETSGLGTATVSISSGDGREGTALFHFVKLCCVDEDEEVVWLTPDAGSYLLNEVARGDSSIELVSGMAFRFYYDGPKMDEERSIKIADGDDPETEHTFDFIMGEHTTERRAIIYQTDVRELLDGCEALFDGQGIELVHNAPPEYLPHYYQLVIDNEPKCVTDAPNTPWLRITAPEVKLYGTRNGGPVTETVTGEERSFDLDINTRETDEPYVWCARTPMFRPQVTFQIHWKDLVTGSAKKRLRWYQVAEWIKYTYTEDGQAPQDRYASKNGPTQPRAHQDEVSNPLPEWRLADALPGYKVGKKWSAEYMPRNAQFLGLSPTWKRVTGKYRMWDEPGFRCLRGDRPALRQLECSAKWSTYLVIVEQVKPDAGCAVVNAIMKIPWKFKGVRLQRATGKHTWYAPRGPVVTMTVDQETWDTPGHPDIVDEEELFDVYTWDEAEETWITNSATRSRCVARTGSNEVAATIRGGQP